MHGYDVFEALYLKCEIDYSDQGFWLKGGSAYEIKFDFLFCFLLVCCLLLNDRHVKLLRNPSFRFMWSKSNKFLLNLYHKINPIAIFFHYEMRMMFTNRLNSRAPCFFLSVWANSLLPWPVLTQGRIFTKYMTCISLV